MKILKIYGKIFIDIDCLFFRKLYQYRAYLSQALIAWCFFPNIFSIASILYHVQEGLNVLGAWFYAFISLSSG